MKYKKERFQDISIMHAYMCPCTYVHKHTHMLTERERLIPTLARESICKHPQLDWHMRYEKKLATPIDGENFLSDLLGKAGRTSQMSALQELTIQYRSE